MALDDRYLLASVFLSRRHDGSEIGISGLALDGLQQASMCFCCWRDRHKHGSQHSPNKRRALRTGNDLEMDAIRIPKVFSFQSSRPKSPDLVGSSRSPMCCVASSAEPRLAHSISPPITSSSPTQMFHNRSCGQAQSPTNHPRTPPDSSLHRLRTH